WWYGWWYGRRWYGRWWYGWHGRHDVRPAARPGRRFHARVRLRGKKKQLRAGDPTRSDRLATPNSRDQRGKLPAGPGVVPTTKKAPNPGRDDPPMIEAAQPKAAQPPAGFIAVPAGPPTVGPKKKTVTTWQYWDHFYDTHDEDLDELRDKVRLLNVNRKFED